MIMRHSVERAHGRGYGRDDEDYLAHRLFTSLPWPYPTENITPLRRWAEQQEPSLTYLEALRLMEAGTIKVEAMRWVGPKGGKRRVWGVKLDQAIIDRLGLRPAVLMAAWRRPQP